MNRAAQCQLDYTFAVTDTLKVPGVYRSVELTVEVVDALRSHRAAENLQRIAAKHWANPDLVFASVVAQCWTLVVYGVSTGRSATTPVSARSFPTKHVTPSRRCSQNQR